MTPELALAATRYVEQAAVLLETAELGLADLRGRDARRRVPGLNNVVTFGRAVTIALQRIRGIDPEFDPWYAEAIAELSAVPLFTYLNQLRNRLLKQGEPISGVRGHVGKFSPADLDRLPRPANAVGFFLADQRGGSGWMVELGDGTRERYYIDLPDEIVTATIMLRDYDPARFGGDGTAEEACARYCGALRAVVTRARQRYRAP